MFYSKIGNNTLSFRTPVCRQAGDAESICILLDSCVTRFTHEKSSQE